MPFVHYKVVALLLEATLWLQVPPNRCPQLLFPCGELRIRVDVVNAICCVLGCSHLHRALRQAFKFATPSARDIPCAWPLAYFRASVCIVNYKLCMKSQRAACLTDSSMAWHEVAQLQPQSIYAWA
jgi:hypothetical protein